MDTRGWKDKLEMSVFWLFLVSLIGLAWFFWPQISSFLSRPAPGSPRPGMDCYEVDWDEWGRPLWECSTATELPPIDYDLSPWPGPPEYDEYPYLDLPPRDLYPP